MKRLFLYYTKQSAVKKISDAIFTLGLLFSLYTFWVIRKSYADLPSNVCPIEKHHTEIYIALFLLITSVILTFFEKKPDKETQLSDDPK